MNQEGTELGPLPGGHHGLTREQVAESQRERLLAATAQLVAQGGFRATTITDIAKTASVANRVFYANFADKEEAFLAAFDALASHLREVIEGAAGAAPDWPAAVVAALRTALEFFDSERDFARFCLVAPLSATPPIAAHFRTTIDDLLPPLQVGREQRPNGAELPPSTEDTLLGGVITQVSRRLGDEQSLTTLLPDLVEFVLSPYLGAEAAARLAAEA